MANVRIKDIQNTATSATADDYLAIDGSTAGTRKIKPADLTKGCGLTEDVKQALLQIAEKVVYVDDQGEVYYNDLYDALYPPAPPATLLSITAVYTQSGTVYDTDTLDSLKPDLVVTGSYDDGSVRTITDYTLSGTLAEGTSTITVSYQGKETTFTVNVTEFVWYTVTNADCSISNYQNIRGTTYMKVNSINTEQENLYLPKLTSGNYTAAYLSLPTTAKYIKFADDAVCGDLSLSDGSVIKIINVPEITTKFVVKNCTDLVSIDSPNTKAYSLSAVGFTGDTKLESFPPSFITGFTGSSLQESFKNTYSLDDLSSLNIPSTFSGSLFNAFNGSGITKSPQINSEALGSTYGSFGNCNNLEEIIFNGLTLDATTKSDLYTTPPKSFDFRCAFASASYPSMRTAAASSVSGASSHFYHLVPNNDTDIMRSITCWGDSLTHYGADDKGNMPAQLLGFMASNVTVYNNAFFGAHANPNATTNSFKPFFDLRTKFYGDVTVIWLGTNDMHSSVQPSTIADYIEDTYVDALTTEQYIVLNPWPERTCTDVFASRFGNHFLDIQAYTLTNWESITGITPTAEDEAAVSSGNIPPSLLADSVHINNDGGLVVATGIKDKLLALGYITNDWLIN